MSTYNGERFLAEQLESILTQTITEWQLFIRDDGSTDKTVDIVEQYAKKDKRISIIKDKKNIGALRSFECLLQQSDEADYYTFADQDDVWQPDKLEICLEVVLQAEKEYPDKPIVVHTDLQVVDEDLTEIAPSFWKYSHIRPDLQDNNIRYLAISNSVTGCAMMFNKRARACCLPIPSKAHMHDAWVALMTAVHGGKVIPVRRTTLAYRQHGENTLGAVKFSIWQGFAQRRRVSMRNYRMAHPDVYTNQAEFYSWKLIYLLHRALYSLLHS